MANIYDSTSAGQQHHIPTNHINELSPLNHIAGEQKLLSRNNSQIIGNAQANLSRHQSVASVSSIDTVATSGRLLDRLELDDDLPWANNSSPGSSTSNLRHNLQSKRQPSPSAGAGLSYGGLINNGSANGPARRSVTNNNNSSNSNSKNGTRFVNRLDSLRYNNSAAQSQESITSAAKTAAALGSTVSEVQNTQPVVVGHIDVDQQAFAKATLEMNDEDDDEVNGNDTNTLSRFNTAQSSSSSTAQSQMYLNANNSSASANSKRSSEFSGAPAKRIDPNELRVKKAIQLRKEGKPREASYELSIAAHHGSKSAMLLYGLSLRYGYGLRVDPKQSFLWISRSAGCDLILNANSNYSVDPFSLSDATIPKPMPEPDGKAFFELGIAFLNGIGTEKDENRALQFFEKSASLGNVDAMTQAGMLWSKKGHHGRKKDLYRSAAWLRFADKRGADNVGNSWIYKDKYIKRKE